jgi:hypothetical protein
VSIVGRNRELTDFELTIGATMNSLDGCVRIPIQIQIQIRTRDALSFAEHVAEAAKRRLEARPLRRGARGTATTSEEKGGTENA